MAESEREARADRQADGDAKAGSGRARRIVMVLVAVALLAGFGVLVVVSYDRGSPSVVGKDAPMITADKGPTRKRPEKPGGMVVPDRDKQVFSRINPTENPPQIEHLLPPPEVAVARPPAGDLGALRTAPDVGSGAVEVLVGKPKPKPKPAAKKKQRKPAPEKQIASLPAPKAKPAPEAAVEPKAKPAVKALPLLPQTPVAKPKKAVEQLIAPPPRAVRQTVKIASLGSERGWRVQIAAFRSAEAAKRSWKKLQRRHADLLGPLALSVVRADLGDKGVYHRMQAGPLADRAAAKKLCALIKQRKLGCLVVRP